MTTLTRPRFSGPWEVEEDISIEEVYARRRPEEPIIRLDRLADNIPRWIAEAQHLADSGVTDFARIARAVGCGPETFEKHVAPKVNFHRHWRDRRAAEALYRLVEKGAPFHTGAIPMPADDFYIQGIVSMLQVEHRIVKHTYDAHLARWTWRPTTPEERAALDKARAEKEERARLARNARRAKPNSNRTDGRPENCTGGCGRRLVYDGDTERPEGAVRHNSRGRCNACSANAYRERDRRAAGVLHRIEHRNELIGKARTLAVTGLPSSQIAKQIGAGVSTVRRWRRDGLLTAA